MPRQVLFIFVIFCFHKSATSAFLGGYLNVNVNVNVGKKTTTESKIQIQAKQNILQENADTGTNLHAQSTNTGIGSTIKSKSVDKRPHEQRVRGPRKARRLNHSFMHLYRHESPLFEDRSIAPSSKVLTSARVYLKDYGGFSDEDIDAMSVSFPPLLDLDVKRHLRPKVRFIKHTLLKNGNVDVNRKDHEQDKKEHLHRMNEISKNIPPQYFGSRMEKVVAPKHAFLMYMGLPHGPVLLENNATLFKDFLLSCRRTKTFCYLCNQWRNEFGSAFVDEHFSFKAYESEYEYEKIQNNVHSIRNSIITPKQVDAFDSLFLRGIMAAARDDMDPQGQHLQHVNITACDMIYLLTRHGSNPLETDVRDISLLHWAAGSGQTGALRQLIQALPGGIEEAVKLSADRDGASILHWAAAGAKSKSFGCGGHIDVCRFLMDNCGGRKVQRDVVNKLTKDGNSVLMWAAWSGTLDVVKLMVRHRADPHKKNRNGCSVAHWASSGGNLEVCKYLHDTIDVDFTEPNYAGNTPLSHAVAYGRTDVVSWLKNDVKVDDVDGRAQDLAINLFSWDTIEEGDERREAFSLFNDDWD